METDGFSFPKLPVPKQQSFPQPAPRVPLTVNSTVIDRSADGPASTSGQQQAPGKSQQVAAAAAAAKATSARPGKIPLEKGYSQMDWMRLTRAHPDLAGLGGGPLRRSIPLAEVKQHRTQDDAWTVLRGKVYNITPYLNFHPGGVKYLMMGAGRDCTALFNKYHAWVNAEFLLEKCLIGLLEPAHPKQPAGILENGS